MQDNMITWNLANWVSIVLMALIAFLALGVVVSFVKKGRFSSDSADQSTGNAGVQAYSQPV